MTKIILEGGTDVAEMALFCVDDAPANLSDIETVMEMQNRKSIVRLPTGADGGYLLHLYVAESIQDEAFEFCVQEDKLVSEFNTINGNIGFGGLESTYSNFKTNKSIRQDVKIEKGSYLFTAFHTLYPDEAIEEAIAKEIGSEGTRKLNISKRIVLFAVVTCLCFLFFGLKYNYAYLALACAVIPLAIFVYRKYTETESYKKIEQKKKEIERNFPSIVIHLQKNA